MSKDLVKQENTALAKQQAGGIGRGFERLDMESVSMPRVKVMQGLSPELQDEDYDFRQGDIIHGLLMEKMPEKFIPLMIWDSRIKFIPRDEGGGIECRSYDAKSGMAEGASSARPCSSCPYAHWDGDTPPECTLTVNVLALFEGYTMPVVIQFANTSWKYGNKFKQMAVFSGGDIFGKKYKLVSKKETNPKGVFYTLQVKPAGLPTEEEYKLAEALYKQFNGVRIETQQEDDMGEVEDAGF